MAMKPDMFGLTVDLEWGGSGVVGFFRDLDDKIRHDMEHRRVVNVARLVSIFIYVLILSSEINNRLKCALRLRNMSPGLHLTLFQTGLLFAFQIVGIFVILGCSFVGTSFIISSCKAREVILNASAGLLVLNIDNLLLGAFLSITDTTVTSSFWKLSVPLVLTRRKSQRVARRTRVILMSVITSLVSGVAATPFILAQNKQGHADAWFFFKLVMLLILVNIVLLAFSSAK
eukprot:GHVR01173369.1.p1 GENE.GHVR01173369.1~~GHVR01173369.1.p1  ORF type:complete len:230 (+),score=35.28 GHVR01173369.1:45-734(+)